MKKKMIAVVMTLALILSAVSVTPSMTAYAKTKSPKLSKKKIVMMLGKTQKIKLKNVSKKVKWTVAKKQVVKITKKSGTYNNSIVIKGLKAGSTKITAQCGKKKYKVKVTVKKEAAPSVSPTQQATTKVTEATTSKMVEITTTKEIEVTTSKEVEITTTEEIPEQTTESHTTEELTENFTTEEATEQEQTTEEATVPETTTMEPASEEPTGEMMTTEQSTEDISTSEEQTEHLTTEEETTTEMPTLEDVTDEKQTDEELTTQEPTTEEAATEAETTVEESTTVPEITTRETKLVAEVLNDGLTTDDTLQIKYYFDGPTDVLLWTDCNPHTLEIYENDQWNSLEYSEDVNFYAGMSRISEEAFALKIPLSQSYTNVKPGHYKYTQPLYIDGSEKPFGESIFVEFDVTYPEFYVEGKVKNNQIKSTNDLEIIYTIVTESEAEYTYDEHPYNLYKYDEYDYWKKCKLIPDILLTDRVYKTITGNSVINITIPLKEYFGTLSPGKYKYVHEIAGKRVGVVFEIGN